MESLSLRQNTILFVHAGIKLAGGKFLLEEEPLSWRLQTSLPLRYALHGSLAPSRISGLPSCLTRWPASRKGGVVGFILSQGMVDALIVHWIGSILQGLGWVGGGVGVTALVRKSPPHRGCKPCQKAFSLCTVASPRQMKNILILTVNV